MYDLSEILNWAEILTQGIIGVGTLILSFVLWRTSKKHLQAEFSRAMHENWTSINIAMLQNEEMAKLCDETLFNHKKPKKSAKNYHTKRYIIFLHLNIMEADFEGYKAGLISKNVFNEALDDLIIPIYEKVSHQLHNGGFSEEFIQYCELRFNKFKEPKTK